VGHHIEQMKLRDQADRVRVSDSPPPKVSKREVSVRCGAHQYASNESKLRRAFSIGRFKLKIEILGFLDFALETNSFEFAFDRRHWFEHPDGKMRRWEFVRKTRRAAETAAV